MSLGYKTELDSDGNLIWYSFDKYNIDSAIKKFDPSGKGARDAMKHKPGGGEELRASERVMLDDVRKHLNVLKEFVRHQLDNAVEDAQETAKEIGDPGTKSKDITSRFSSLAETKRTDATSIPPKIRDFDMQSRYLNYFRHEHKLDHRPATYPESQPHVIMFLIWILIAEAVANSFFFQHGSDLGLAGGMIDALLISLANVAVSFGAGFLCLRYLQHNTLLKKLLGGIGFIVALCCVTFLHLATAHYRELSIQSSEFSITGALGAVANNPFGISDLYSLVLIFIGFMISFVACYKGFNFDDHYPGYGKIWRKFDEAKVALDREKQAFRETVCEARDKSIDGLYKVGDKLSSCVASLNVIKGDIKAFLNDHQAYADQAGSGAKTLLSIYRSSYQKILGGNDEMKYRDSLVDSLEIPNYQKMADTALTTINKLGAEVKNMQNSFQDELEENINKIQTISSGIISDPGMEKIEKKARKEIEKEIARAKAAIAKANMEKIEEGPRIMNAN